MARRCRGVDWSRTPLGSADDWPASLRIAVRMVLESPFPIALWCGSSLTLIYNDGYGAVLGSKHPSALGRPGHEVWKEIWPTIEVMFRRGAAARTTYAENARFEMDRADGTLGEAWFTYAVSPIRDESGDIVAFLNPATETTSRVMVERELERARETAERAERRIHDVFARHRRFSPCFEVRSIGSSSPTRHIGVSSGIARSSTSLSRMRCRKYEHKVSSTCSTRCTPPGRHSWDVPFP